jgi:hypothetical protein
MFTTVLTPNLRQNFNLYIFTPVCKARDDTPELNAGRILTNFNFHDGFNLGLLLTFPDILSLPHFKLFSLYLYCDVLYSDKT